MVKIENGTWKYQPYFADARLLRGPILGLRCSPYRSMAARLRPNLDPLATPLVREISCD